MRPFIAGGRMIQAFDRACRFSQQEGYHQLADNVVKALDRALDTMSPRRVQMIFNMRCRQLVRLNPRFFGGRDMKC